MPRQPATTNLHICGVPVVLRDKVRARAAKKGQTMSQYLIELIQRAIDDQEHMEKWGLEPSRA